MRGIQIAALLLGALVATVGLITLASAEAVASFLAGVVLVLLSLPCFAVAAAIFLGRRTKEVVSRTLTEVDRLRVEDVLRENPGATFEELHDELRIPEEKLTRGLHALLEAREAVEDFDEERGAFVYTMRPPQDVALLDPDAPVTAPPPDAPAELVSVRERLRRLDRERA